MSSEANVLSTATLLPELSVLSRLDSVLVSGHVVFVQFRKQGLHV